MNVFIILLYLINIFIILFYIFKRYVFKMKELDKIEENIYNKDSGDNNV